MFSLQFSVISVQIHSSYLYMSLHVWYAHIERITKELESKMCEIFIILSSCENWVTQISKILIQLDSSHQYDCFEVQHAYVMIKSKEVYEQSNISQVYFMFSLQFSVISVQIHSSHLYMSLYVWYTHIERITKELESKMCKFLSFWVVVRTG